MLIYTGVNTDIFINYDTVSDFLYIEHDWFCIIITIKIYQFVFYVCWFCEDYKFQIVQFSSIFRILSREKDDCAYYLLPAIFTSEYWSYNIRSDKYIRLIIAEILDSQKAVSKYDPTDVIRLYDISVLIANPMVHHDWRCIMRISIHILFFYSVPLSKFVDKDT